MLEFFLLAMLIGVVAGLLAGLFGLGGGVVIVPALMWLFIEQQVAENQIMIMAVATSLATIILTSISSLISHQKLGNIMWDRVYMLTPGILIGSATGAILADWVSADALKGVFISYLFCTSAHMVLQISPKNKHKNAKVWLDYVTGNGIGLISSLLGIGGGTLMVPYLVGRQIPIKNAVAISSVCGLPIALSGTVSYMFLGWENTVLPEGILGYIYLPAFFGITLCSILTAPLGAILADKLPAKKLKRYFSLLVFLVAIKMMFQ